jgi:UDP-N-acetylglucosamine--N-acetylmuramyl-(pentapeptide) pyrophosphoryl-undecaprenol N-acetylglucosamine transferase
MSGPVCDIEAGDAAAGGVGRDLPLPHRDDPPARIVLAGGGTGGHIYPAVSLARALEAEHIAFMGTRDGLEAEVVPRAGFSFHAVPSRKLSRKPSLQSLAALAVLGWGTVKSAWMLRTLRPDVVVGTGGYVSAGVLLAAALQRIPTLIHEQNAIPGRTNRLLARFVSRIAITFPEAARYFPAEKTVLTGLPIRPEIGRADRAAAQQALGLARDRFTLLVLGGSQGARTLNRATLDALASWGDLSLQVLHQIGKAVFAEWQPELAGRPAWYRPVPYFDAIEQAYAAADLVLCRAGASTLAEITAAGLPSILVPYPYAMADHQTHNARALVDAGAALLLPNADTTGARIAAEVRTLMSDRGVSGRLAAMSIASRALGRPEAAARLADEVLALATRRR